MLKATMTPAQIAQRIAAIADTLDELSNQYTDLALAVEELKEENKGAKRYEAADVFSDHAMDQLHDAERCLRKVVHFLNF